MKIIQKIWFFSLCLSLVILTGCFHIPDEDWLPSKNKVKVETTNNEEQIFLDSINTAKNMLNNINNSEETSNNESTIINEEITNEEIIEDIDETKIFEDTENSQNIDTNVLNEDIGAIEENMAE